MIFNKQANNITWLTSSLFWLQETKYVQYGTWHLLLDTQSYLLCSLEGCSTLWFHTLRGKDSCFKLRNQCPVNSLSTVDSKLRSPGFQDLLWVILHIDLGTTILDCSSSSSSSSSIPSAFQVISNPKQLELFWIIFFSVFNNSSPWPFDLFSAEG